MFKKEWSLKKKDGDLQVIGEILASSGKRRKTILDTIGVYSFKGDEDKIISAMLKCDIDFEFADLYLKFDKKDAKRLITKCMTAFTEHNDRQFTKERIDYGKYFE